MANLMSHALFAMAIQGIIGAICGYPLISAGVFAAGIFAMMPDLDRGELSPGGNTPMGHSIIFGGVWAVIGGIVLTLLGVPEFGLAFATGYASHLFLDALTTEGIYLFPTRLGGLKGILTPLPHGADRVWPAWTRLSIPATLVRFKSDGDPIANLVTSLVSLVMLICYIAASPMPMGW